MFGLDFRKAYVGDLARYTIPRGAVSSVCTRIDSDGSNNGTGALRCVTVVPRGLIYVDQTNQQVCLTNQELDSGYPYKPRSAGSDELVTTPYNGTVMKIKKTGSNPAEIELKDYNSREVIKYQVWTNPQDATDCKYLRRSTDYYDVKSDKLASAKFDITYDAGDYASHDTGLTRGDGPLASWHVFDPMTPAAGGSITAVSVGNLGTEAGFEVARNTSFFNAVTYQHLQRETSSNEKVYISWSRPTFVHAPEAQAAPGFKAIYYPTGTAGSGFADSDPIWKIVPVVVPWATAWNSPLNTTNFPSDETQATYMKSTQQTVTLVRFGGAERTIYSSWGAFGPTVVTSIAKGQEVGTMTTVYDALGRVVSMTGTGKMLGGSTNTFDAQTGILTTAAKTAPEMNSSTEVTTTVGTDLVLPETIVQKVNNIAAGSTVYTYDTTKIFPVITETVTTQGPRVTRTVYTNQANGRRAETTVTGDSSSSTRSWDAYGMTTSILDTDGMSDTSTTWSGYGSTNSQTFGSSTTTSTSSLNGTVIQTAVKTTTMNGAAEFPLVVNQTATGGHTMTQQFGTATSSQYVRTTTAGPYGSNVTTLTQVPVGASYTAFRRETESSYTPPGSTTPIVNTGFCQTAPNGSYQCSTTDGVSEQTKSRSYSR